MSHKSNMYTNRRSSKVVWFIFGGAIFLLIVYPYFGNNFRYLISSSLEPLRYFGAFSFSAGMAISVGAIFLKPFRRFKIIIAGIILVVIGMALGAPNLFLSLFTGSSRLKGYHFFY